MLRFKLPETVKADYKGEIAIVFEVTKEGVFKTIYVDAQNIALKEEATRVFSAFPKIEPATYNGNPTFKQYSMTLYFPLNENNIPSNAC